MSRLTPFFQSDLFRNAGKLLSASVVVQLIGIAVYPVLTRIYPPEEFGLLNLFQNIAATMVGVATAEYQYAIVLPKEEKEARSIFHLGLLLLLSTSVLAALSVPFARPIAHLFKAPELVHYYGFIPLLVLAMGLWNLLNYWYVRQKAYTSISGFQLSQSLIGAGSKLAFGFGGCTVGGLIWGSFIATSSSIILSFSLAFRRILRPLTKGFSFAAIRQVARTYRNFPLFTLPRNFLNLLVGQLPVFVLTPCFGARNVGFWGMALFLSYAPITMINRAVYQVLYQHFTERVHRGMPLMPLMRRFTRGISLLVLPTFGALYWVLPALTQWFLGEEWVVSGQLIRWMLPWLYAMFLTGATCFMADVFMKQKIGLYFEILLAVMRVAGLLLGVCLQSFTVAIAGYCMGSALVIAAQYVWILSLCKAHDRTLPNE